MRSSKTIGFSIAAILLTAALFLNQPSERETKAIELHTRTLAEFNDADSRNEEYLAKAHASEYGSDEAINYLIASKKFLALKKECLPMIDDSAAIIAEEQHDRHVRVITLLSVAGLLLIIVLVTRSTRPQILHGQPT